MRPRLIINADDFGLTEGINYAILQLHREGAVPSATLMATGPAFAHAVALARATPTLGVGCHLVFVDGIPISHPEAIPSLLCADGKTFRPSLLDFAQAALRGAIRSQDIATETQAQIQKLQRAGIDVTHIDTHKHTHAFPALARTVLHIARRCGVSAFRNPFEPAWSRAASRKFSPALRSVQTALLHRFSPAFRKLLRAETDETSTSGTLGILATGCLTPTLLRSLLAAVADQPDESVFELCCHPGLLDPALEVLPTRLQASRALEIPTLRNAVPQIQSTAAPIQLIHYGNLGIPGLQRASGHFVPHNGFEKVL